MNFLAPIFLAAAAAIAIPLFLHLIRRRPKKQIDFSATRFLTPSIPTITRRSRFEHWLLLLLRCLVILFLAAAFSRPFLNKPIPVLPGQSIQRHRVILVDTSASMRRPNLWQDAMEEARKALQQLDPDDVASVITFDRHSSEVISFSEWLQLPSGDRTSTSLAKLESVKPSWYRTELASALIAAVKRLQESPSGSSPSARKEIHLITDFQDGSRLDDLRGFVWPKDCEVTLVQLKPTNKGNSSLQSTVSQEFGVAPEKRVRLRGVNTTEPAPEKFQVDWMNASVNKDSQSLATTSDWTIPVGQMRPLSIPTNINLAAPHVVRISGDNAEFDNRFYLAPSLAHEAEIGLAQHSHPENSAVLEFYLRSVFPTNANPLVRLEPLVSTNSAQIRKSIIALLPTSDHSIQQIEEALDRGATVLCVLGEAGADAQLGKLLQLTAPLVAEVESSGYQLLADIDFSHPFFRPLSDARFNDFTKIHFWKHRKFDTNNTPRARAIAKFENGNPALVEIPIRNGRVYVLTSSWHPKDSQLALSSKFIPLLFSFLDISGVLTTKPNQIVVGSPIEVMDLNLANNKSTVRLHLPNGKAATIPDDGVYRDTGEPGFYRVAPGDKWIAVNLSPEESRTQGLQPDALERLGVVLTRSAITRNDSTKSEQKKRADHAVHLESQQRLWRWCLAAALLLLTLETWLANRTPGRVINAQA